MLGLLFVIFGAVFGPAFGEYIEYFGDFSDLNMLMDSYDIEMLGSLGGIIAVVVGIVFIIAATAIALLNVFVLQKMRKCAKSTLLTFQTGVNQIVNLKLTKNWIMVLGVLQGVSALSNLSDINLLGAVSEGAIAAAFVLFYLLLADFEKKQSLQNPQF